MRAGTHSVTTRPPCGGSLAYGRISPRSIRPTKRSTQCRPNHARALSNGTNQGTALRGRLRCDRRGATSASCSREWGRARSLSGIRALIFKRSLGLAAVRGRGSSYAVVDDFHRYGRARWRRGGGSRPCPPLGLACSGLLGEVLGSPCLAHTTNLLGSKELSHGGLHSRRADPEFLSHHLYAGSIRGRSHKF